MLSTAASIRFHKIVATALGAGYSPIAPGTVGAVVGVVAIVLLFQIPYLRTSPLYFFLTLCVLSILFCTLGAWSARVLEPLWGKDPSKVVIDEVVGIWIAMWGLPVRWEYLLAAFVLFRFFDIAKPLGIRRMEMVPYGWGVMLDDVLAGLYALMLLWGYRFFFI